MSLLPGCAGAGAEAPRPIRAFSAEAESIDLCLFDASDPNRQTDVIPMTRRGPWEWTADGVRSGVMYAFRAGGPWDPRRGLTFNANKLLLDPLAPAIVGNVRWDDATFGYRTGEGGWDGAADARDSAAFVPRGLIVEEAFDWGEDHPPATPWRDTFIYECHVKGATILHPDVPECDRGRYLGLASEAFLDHVQSLGVTALELMPVQASLTRRWLTEKGLTNYWGYDPVSFVAPDARFATGDRGEQVVEFKRMIKALHARGLEVILDVVFNHTVEGDERGPTLSLRGLDSRAYYRLDAEGRCVDCTGCGNTINTDHPLTRRMILDALRTWVTRMHVDGFRLDLASTLGRRGSGGFDPEHPLIVEMREDPVLARVKIIAEPWDARADGYALGRFPRGWPEWNDRYRDRVRRFWRGDGGQVGAIASAVAGSSDLLSQKRSPLGGVNFVACHDGFTLRDLTMYERRQNDANGEQGRDGHADNLSRNWGVEGSTDDPRVLQLRERAQRNLLATVALSIGVPMITAGDEFGRTQGGNNNAYCQDNVISWLRWPVESRAADARRRVPGTRSLTGAARFDRRGERAGLRALSIGDGTGAPSFLMFARNVFALRRAFGVFRADRFLTGAVQCPCGIEDVSWRRPDGAQMSHETWHEPERRALLMLRHGHHDAGASGGSEATDIAASRGYTVACLLNAGAETTWFTLPRLPLPGCWIRVLSTLRDVTVAKVVRSGRMRVPPHSLAVLRFASDEDGGPVVGDAATGGSEHALLCGDLLP